MSMSAAERTKRYRQRHPERYRESEKAMRHRHPEKFRAKYRRQYAANAEKRSAAAQARRDRNRDAYNAQVRARRARNPEKHRAILARRNARVAHGAVTAEHLKAQMASQNGRCFYCDADVSLKYEIDHFISLANGGPHVPENIVLACPSCNRRKNKLNGLEFMAKLRRAA